MEGRSHEISMAVAALRGSGRGRDGSTRLNAVDCDIPEVWICQLRASKVGPRAAGMWVSSRQGGVE
jgi:hypothetical protein